MTDAPTEREGEGSWAKLRRRKVVQWGIAYAAGAWGLLQGIAYLRDTFGWPHELQQVATIALLAGLPVTMTLAWYHGDKGQQRVTRAEIAILSLLVVVGGGLIWRYERAAPFASNATTTTAEAPTAAAPSATKDARPSIAVLPFENRSAKADDAFFVDGIQDDILTQLSRVSALKVISRTSVERFRKTELPIREIAQQLGVATILEGGVQRAGDRVRINVQLIDAASDAHLWAENYDRELTASNIFAIQSEVASAIALALNAALTPREKTLVAALPTRSLAAWEAYQLGRQRLMRRTGAAISEAKASFQTAVDQDPEFALAYAGLADATWLDADYNGRAMGPAVAKAEEHLGTALRLDPNLAEARATLAKFAQDRREFEKAETLYREAIQLNPNYSQAYHWYAQLLTIEGRDDEAMASLQRAAALDPLSPSLQASLASALSATGRFDEALNGFDKARGIDPLSALSYEGIGSVLARAYGRLDEAIPFYEKAHQLDPNRTYILDHLAQSYLDLGEDSNADTLLRGAHDIGGDDSLAVAYLHLYRGKWAPALELSVKAFDFEPRNRDALRLLRDADLRNRDAASALARYARAYPELLQRGPPAIDWSNKEVAIDLALVLQSTGAVERAADLINRYDAFVRRTRMIRMGPWGYGVADAQVLAMRGKTRDALSALRSAEVASWRGPYWRYYRDFDPALDSIRNDPEFKAIFADIERDMARQRAKLASRPKDAPLDLGESRG